MQNLFSRAVRAGVSALMVVTLTASPVLAKQSSVASAKGGNTIVTVCQNFCNFDNLQDALNSIQNLPGNVEIKVLSNLNGEDTQANYTVPYLPKITVKCYNNAILDAGERETMLTLHPTSTITNVTIENCRMTGTTVHLIGTFGVGLTLNLINNRIYDNDTVVWSDTQNTRVNLLNNVFESNFYAVVDFNQPFSELKAHNNVASYSQYFISARDTHNTVVNLEHNTIKSMSTPVYVNDYSEGQLKNNIFSSIYWYLIVGGTTQYCEIGTNNNLLNGIEMQRLGCTGQDVDNRTGNPLFIDSDLRVSLESAAIDIGDSSDIVNDRDGFCRGANNQPDAGAYEANSPCRIFSPR